MGLARRSVDEASDSGENRGGALRMPELTILMPCLNEALTLARCIAKARRFLDRSGIAGEIVVADNGSTDGSREIAAAEGARVVPVAARGYGAALIGGIASARGRYVVMGDADDSYDFSALDGFVAALRGGADLVMGNRFRGGIRPGAMPFLHRYLGNPVLSGLGRLFFGSPVGDFHCGLRAFRREAILPLDLRANGMEFASEMVVKATLARLRIAEVPTVLSKDGRDRPPHLRTWRDGWLHLRFLLLYSPRWLYLVPGLGLALGGLVLMAVLLQGPLAVMGTALDVNALVVAGAAISVGVQALILFYVAKQFAIGHALLPPTPRFIRLSTRITPERAVATGAFLALGGLLGIVGETAYWAMTGFGELDASRALRLVVPAATALTVGLQLVFGGFISSLLGLRLAGGAARKT